MSRARQRRKARNRCALVANSSYRLCMAPSSKLSRLKDLPPWERPGYEVVDEYDSSEPAEGDRLVLEQLVAMGADLSNSRHVVHYFYFPNDVARDAAESQLRLKGYRTRHGVQAPAPNPKSLIAERHGLVDGKTIEEERFIFTAIAEAGNGEYDGWEAQLD